VPDPLEAGTRIRICKRLPSYRVRPGTPIETVASYELFWSRRPPHLKPQEGPTQPMQRSLAKRRVALLGIGHTNAQILRRWRTHELPNVELVCVSNFRKATYSGMLPGVLAGQYEQAQMEIDLVRLCAAARATLVIANVDGLNLELQQLRFTDRAPLEFDVLSIGIGSVPTFAGVTVGIDLAVAIKPMQTFIRRLDERLRRAAAKRATTGDDTLRIVVAGAGAGGLEIAMCLPAHLAALQLGKPFRLAVVSHAGILPGSLPRTANRVARVLDRRGVEVHPGQGITAINNDSVTLANGQSLPADVVVWATGATANRLLGRFGLPVDEFGFLWTEKTLKSTADVPIFAVGDSGTIRNVRLPKAGVYAVRQGPVLWRNLSHLLRQEPLEDYRPQSGFLKLLNRGDGGAIGEFLGCSFSGRWAGKWKDAIDRSFIAKYQDVGP
jgi:selenide,water dikinase